MATVSSKCNHQFHKNHITDIEPIMDFPTLNRAFILCGGTLYVIDNRQYTRYCKLCNLTFILYLYKDQTCMRASFDGVTDLPLYVCRENITFIFYMRLCSEPSFGKFLYVYSIRPFIPYLLYCIGGSVVPYRDDSQMLVDGIPAICCETTDDEIILINLHGKIIETTKNLYADADDKSKFKIGNNVLFAKNYYANCTIDKWEWTYINKSLNTKPSARAANE
jgi:hypothetical protein